MLSCKWDLFSLGAVKIYSVILLILIVLASFPFTLNNEIFIPVLKNEEEKKIKVNIYSMVIFLATFSDFSISICIMNMAGAENMFFSRGAIF